MAFYADTKGRVTARLPLPFSCRKVGGLTFVKLGRFTFMFCVSKGYRPL